MPCGWPSRQRWRWPGCTSSVDLYALRRLREARSVRPALLRTLGVSSSGLVLPIQKIVGLLLPSARIARAGRCTETARPDRHAGGPHESWRCPAGCSPVRATTRDHRVAESAVAQTVEAPPPTSVALARPPQRRVGIAGGGRLDQRIQIAQQRSRRDRSRACGRRPSRPAARERLVRRQFTQTALDGPVGTRGSGDQRRAAITDRLGLSRRPHPARSLREHGRQRCMLCPQGGQLHGRSVLLADQQYKQLFPYSLLRAG